MIHCGPRAPGMAVQRRMCSHHADRPAIGVCVITKQAICAECSTRYEGVNYSREGLRILQERRAAEKVRGRRGLLGYSFVVLTPIMLASVCAFYVVALPKVIDLLKLAGQL